jgi:hypothetical protein
MARTYSHFPFLRINYMASFLSRRAKQKGTAGAVIFCLEMKRADAHEASCEATHETGLRPMKRAFGSRKVTLRLASRVRSECFTAPCAASYRRSRCKKTKKFYVLLTNIRLYDINYLYS